MAFEYYIVKAMRIARKVFHRIWDVFIWGVNNLLAKWYFLIPLLLLSMYVLGYWAYWMIKVILT